jgi:hypothetical protein
MTKHQQGTQHESSSQSNVEDILRKHGKIMRNVQNMQELQEDYSALMTFPGGFVLLNSISKVGTMSPPGSITTLILPTLQVADIRSSKHVGHGHQLTSMDIMYPKRYFTLALESAISIHKP